jgi:hypothetical protein
MVAPASDVSLQAEFVTQSNRIWNTAAAKGEGKDGARTCNVHVSVW